MYAVVDIAGQQFKVAKDQRLYVHRLNAKEGSSVDFDNVLLVDNGGKVNVGAPAISGARVTAKVLSHLKGDKVIVFKKKRRKGYQKSNGHRQYFTEIEITQILAEGAKAKAKASEEKPQAKAADKTEDKPKAAAKPKAEVAKPKAEAAKPKAEAKPKTEEKAQSAPAKKDEAKAETKKAAPAKKEAPKAEAKPKAEGEKDNQEEK